MDLKRLAAYSPLLYFDRAEPFYPVRIGVSVLRIGERSPSFRPRDAMNCSSRGRRCSRKYRHGSKQSWTRFGVL
ncbi:hypothetical protein ACFFSY_29000 [Paenibacillus aurantiacus]|uniref:Uncharacterized protein n=1 Tax=Paenibacillus aurantiacus TaxID=1936118 RepID=A0ABV5KXN4_9BACL